MEQAPRSRILVIDDNHSIHEDFRKILGCGTSADRSFLAEKEAFFDEQPGDISAKQFRIDAALQGQEGLTLVESAVRSGDRYSLAFVDIHMPPGWDGIETVSRLWSVDPDLQIVICSAYSDYSWDQMVRRLGHSDSFVILKKPFDNVEVIQLAHALTTKWALARAAEARFQNLDALVSKRTADLNAANQQLRSEIQEKIAAENAVRLSEERFSAAFLSSPMPMSIQALRTGEFVDVNDQLVEMSGFTREDLLGQANPKFDLWVAAGETPCFWELLQTRDRIREFGCHLRTKAGELKPARVFAQLLHLGAEPLVLVVTENITEQVRMETQLRQVQKLEAIGQMAAGVAHDFNNHLTLILGHLSLVLDAHSLEPDVENSVRQALQAGQKAEILTRQLLAFGRKQVMERRRISLAELFRELNGLLQRVLGENIRIDFAAPEALPPVFADPCNLEQVILNLAVNARDAMPNGGQLRITADTVQIGAEELGRCPDAVSGSYIRLAVSDTGCGMDEVTKSKAFEPFFTTKEKGKGTGMGLATVYGIVKQHQGWITLDSEPGAGTTFTVFLPAAAEPLRGDQSASVKQPKLAARRGGETILVVEDEQLIAQFVEKVLSSRGYRTLVARDGVEALQLWQERGQEIDLLLTDIVMPNGISGKDLAERLSADAPRLKIVLTSGYSLDVLGLDPKFGASTYLLQKPYKSDLLLDTIGKALEARSAENQKLVNNRWSEIAPGYEN